MFSNLAVLKSVMVIVGCFFSLQHWILNIFSTRYCQNTLTRERKRRLQKTVMFLACILQEVSLQRLCVDICFILRIQFLVLSKLEMRSLLSEVKQDTIQLASTHQGRVSEAHTESKVALILSCSVVILTHTIFFRIVF